jgi:hypothetical protein
MVKEMKRISPTLTALLSLMIIYSAAFADSIPDAFSGPYVFNTSDMTEIEVNLIRGLKYADGSIEPELDGPTGKPISGKYDANKKFRAEPPLITARLPRALVNICDPYTSKAESYFFDVNELPDEIYCTNFMINYLHPDGLPLTKALSMDWNEMRATRPSPTSPSFGKDFDKLQYEPERIRFLRMEAVVRINEFNGRYAIPTWNKQDQTKNYPNSIVEEYDGYTSVSDGVSNWQYYFDDGPDEIRSVACVTSIEDAQPGFFCTANFPIRDNVFVALTFIDFRLHGGRKFLRERVRMFKKQFCQQLNCDLKSINAAKARQ